MRRLFLKNNFISLVDECNIEDSPGVSLFAIFDGHGGHEVADYAKGTIAKKIAKKIAEAKMIAQKGESEKVSEVNCKATKSYNDDDGAPKTFEAKCYVKDSGIDYEKMLKDEVLAADYDLVQKLAYFENYAGSTALIAVLDGTKLSVANVGDSRGVMCDVNGKTIPLSFDHKPNDPKEHKRIKDAGGFIAHYGVWRVSGVLAMSRALGDYMLKPIVIAEPDVLNFDLNDHK